MVIKYTLYITSIFFLVCCLDATPTSPQGTDTLTPSSPSTEIPIDELSSAAVSPNCQENGCIRWALFLGDYPAQTLRSIAASHVIIENGYSVWQVGYWTFDRETRATFTIPFDAPAPSNGWPLAVNNPGSVGVGDSCALSRSTGAAALAGYFGARRFFGITLDYPGLGYEGIHPYLVSQVNGRASLDALRAAHNFAARFSIPISGKAVITGLSQGGHTTFAAASIQSEYASELDIRAYAVVGAASMFPQHWTPYIQIPGHHLVYHALLTYAWSSYYGHAGPPIWADSIAETVHETMEDYCIVSATSATLAEKLGLLPEDIFSEPYLEAYSTGSFENFNFLSQGFAENQVKPFVQAAPIRFYQGERDAIVPQTDAQELVTTLENNGMTIDFIILPNGHHTNIAFGFLGVYQIATENALEWLKSKL